MMAGLQSLQKKLGQDVFPLIPQTYFANHKSMQFDIPAFPCVVKIGPYHSGYGKILVRDREQFDDVR